MLLIASDMFKAVLYFAYPVAVFVGGSISNENSPSFHDLCETTGFLLAMAIEASDFIILLIAIHTALVIFRPRRSTEKLGLYRYRYAAYGCWAFFSIIMASLAFVRSEYITQGTFCYLPVRPFWYRLALSWIPRYLILCAIIGIYLAVYFYVKRTFGNFDTKFSTDSTPSEESSLQNGSFSGSLPGLDGQPAKTVEMLPIESKGQGSVTLERSLGGANRPIRPKISSGPSWLKYSFGRPTPIPGVRFEEDTTHPMANMAGSVPITSGPFPTSDQSDHIQNRTPTLLEALRDTSIGAAAKKQGPNDPNAAPRKRHKAVQRQLRYLFVYPLVYLLMWIPPFVNHCYFYTHKPTPPFVLNCFSLTCLTLQCAIDCLIFSIREKPWRHISGGNGTSKGHRPGLKKMGFGLKPLLARTSWDNPNARQAVARDEIDITKRQASKRPQTPKNWWDEESRIRGDGAWMNTDGIME
ncbi:hypothetical protein MMC28_005162 [Mycoblastus sanguinarius]|nr:hypothetical protein [Mycoblastus sanguinarius]